jgi:hypothetical protein
LLSGRRVCNQHGINAYPTTIFFNLSRPHRYQVDVFATNMASTLIPPPSFFNQNLPHRYQMGLFATIMASTPYPTTIFFNQSRPHRYQVGVLYICNHLGIGTHAYVSPAGAYLSTTVLQGTLFSLICNKTCITAYSTPILSTRAENV